MTSRHFIPITFSSVPKRYSLALLALLAALPNVICPPVSAEPTAKNSSSTQKTTEATNASEKKTTTPAKPSVKKLANNLYQIGKVTFDKETREIYIPAITNLTETGTLLEYLLVGINGEKVHESLLVTEIDPTNLNIALKLLNYKESQELFPLRDEEGIPGDTYPKVPDAIRKAARISLEVTWKNKTTPLTQWLQHRITSKPMPDTAWVYNGSYILRNKFKAKLSGCIFAIFPNEGSIANYSGEDREDDTLWLANKNLPPIGTKVKVTVKPWSGKLTPQVLKVKPLPENQ